MARAWDDKYTVALGAGPPDLVHDGPLFLAFPETHEFRAAARALGLRGDIALEVGCSYGEATAVLLELGCGTVFGVDNSIECLRHVRETLLPVAGGRLQLQLLDALRYPEQLAMLAATVMPSLLLVDIGGNRDLGSVAATLLTLESSGAVPRLVLVKSRELVGAVQELAASSASRVPSNAAGILAVDVGAGVGWDRLRRRLREATAPPPASGREAARPPPGVSADPIADEDASMLDLDTLAEHNPHCAPGETQLCHSFLNHGRCSRKKGCRFRHISPAHPAAVADAAKRRQLGWLPPRLAAKAARELGGSEHAVSAGGREGGQA
eukprot:scaffold1350_cov113-Isochrysis_galbana.AAC.3